MPLIFFKTPEDAVLILSARQALIYPFSASGWLDLRLGVYLSVTNATESDVTTGLTETMPIGTLPPWGNRFYIGFKQNNGGVPGLNSSFAGVTNGTAQMPTDPNDTKLDPSDGTLTTGTAFWRAYRGPSGTHSVAMRFILGADASVIDKTVDPTGVGLLLRQTTGTGYAALSMIRLTRTTADVASPISINNTGGATINHDYTDTPTIDRIRDFLRNATFAASTGNVFSPSAVPNALYFYWPYFNSRLRIHAIVLEKFS